MAADLAKLEVAAHRGLSSLFCMLPTNWARSRLIELHRVHRSQLTSHLAANRGLAELCLRNPEQIYFTSWDDVAVLDPLNLRNVSSLFGLLLSEYVEGYPEAVRDEVSAELEHVLDGLTTALVNSIESEVAGLACMISRVRSALDDLPHLKEHGRVVLPELPVGNSIPCKLLQRYLGEAGYKVVHTLVALPRNDAKKHGKPRKEILKEKLEEVGPQENDLVLYVDEWFSGVNFNRLSECIEKVLRQHTNVFLMPVGLLLPRSPDSDKYRSFVQKHDARIKGLVGTPSEFRITITPAGSRFIEQPEFFWSEHDRTSGYRKMQLLGAIFSSLDASIDELRADLPKLLDAKERFLHYLVDQGHVVPPEVYADTSNFIAFYDEGYEDYKKRREVLQGLEHMSNLGECESFEQATVELLRGIECMVAGTPSERCLKLAAFYARHRFRPEIDPEDRYYFKAHAPVIDPLPPKRRRYHDLLMKHLRAAVDKRLWPPQLGGERR